MFPLPFTISSILLLVACFISKIQYPATYITIAVYAFLGPLETATLAYTFVSYLQLDQYEFINFILFLLAICLILVFNLIGFAAQKIYLAEDRQFEKWMRRRAQQFDTKFNFYWFYFVSIVSLLSSFKFKLLVFSGLFSFECLKCKLQNVQKFKIFNIFSVLGLVPQIITLYCAFVTIRSVQISDPLFMILLDTIIIFCLNILFSLLATNKDQDFFKEEIHGMPVNKIFNLAEQAFQNSAHIGQKSAKLGQSLADIMELDEFAYSSTKRQNLKCKLKQVKQVKSSQRMFSQYTSQENAVTNSHSNSDYEQSNYINQEKNQELKKIEEQIIIVKEQNNILIINQNYDCQLQQVSSEEKIELDYQRRVMAAQVGLQLPIFSQNVSNITLKQSKNQKLQQKNERINLTQYLMNAQKIQKEEQLKKVPKYDKMQDDKNQILSKRKGKPFQQVKILLAHDFQEKQTVNNEIKRLQQRKSIESPKRQKQLTLNQSKISHLINEIVKTHHSPRKLIEQSQGFKNKRNSTVSLRINQDHDEQPIKSKSKQKLQIYKNYPIRSHSLVHPIRNQKNHVIESSDQSDFLPQAKHYHNDSRNRKDIQRNSAQRQGKNQENEKIRQDKESIIKKLSESSERQKFFFREQMKKQSEEDDAKEFIRSKHKISTLFPRDIPQQSRLDQNNSTDMAPRKPIANHKMKSCSNYFAKKEEKQMEKDNSIFSKTFTHMKSNRSWSNLRSGSSNGERKRQKIRLYGLENMGSLERKKMRSLQKIYLERQVK